MTQWYSEHLNRKVRFVRWGEFGRPVLLFPTAGGDAEECERFLMIAALAPLLESRRIKIYSVDSVAGAAWLSDENPPSYRAKLQNQFDKFLYREVVPAIRRDCREDEIEVITAGASIGAFNAIAALCRHPDVYCAAIGMSGTYDLSPWMKGEWSMDFYFSSPIHFVPNLDEGSALDRLRQRRVLLPTGEGRWEDPDQSWRMAQVLGARGIPNRVDPWGAAWDHDWPTWRRMLPRYLAEIV